MQALGVTLAGAGLVLGTPAMSVADAPAAPPAPAGHEAGPREDDLPAGVVHAGLSDSSACPGGFEVDDSRRRAQCTHGPDPAPVGVDVRDLPSTDELLAAEAAAQQSDPAAAAAPVDQVGCYGDGTSGPRLQAVYAVASDRPDRYEEVVDLVRGYAGFADRAFATSAARDGGVRHLRWVTDPFCALDVARVVLSPAGDDSLSNTRQELKALGFNRTDRKYVVWADAAVYCGIAYVAGDDRPDVSNPANRGPTYARVDSACWTSRSSVVAHEIAHMLGAVSLAAPNSNGAWHCTDEYDRLCYDDGTGRALTYLCASSQEPLLDCNGDDYFNVAPATGSWLSQHWNLASSVFLEPVAGDPPPAVTTTAPPATDPAPTASPSPAPTMPTVPTLPPAPTDPSVTVPPADPTTAVPPSALPSTSTTTSTTTTITPRTRRVVQRHTGRLERGRYRLRVRTADGEVRAVVRGPRRAGLRVVVRDDRGRVVADRSARRNPLVVRRALDAGTYRVVVRGRDRARFELRITRRVTA